MINQDVVTSAPTVEVTISASSPLPLGRQRFRLVVVDDAGNTSVPDEVTVIVADLTIVAINGERWATEGR